MSSSREKKLNKSDVRTGILKFILSFAVLSVVSFLCLFLFFKSYAVQREGIDRDDREYTSLMQKSDQLKAVVDEIYQEMSQHDKVRNDGFLRTSIFDKMKDVKNVMGKDSAGSFKHYAILMKQINPMLTLKKEIVKQENRKQGVWAELQDCMGKTGVVDRELQKDPTRNFTGGKKRK
ncbi:type VI secretion system TssO [Chryseobacterium indologenes]|uniref:Type VI secretion system transmembrane protein TssO n=1 Tax=Chryseobacterium indologenes TaxID=253 RepID=A0A0N0IV98_CHRID|nr:type VI secretion system TssO [Chryseobacterium indologenes]KPE50272.1 hypothetical protein AOB46_16155 [Chryseobacterium indologenes]